MTDRILLKRSFTSGAIPTTASLLEGEVAMNLADRLLYSRSGSVIVGLLPLGTISSSVQINTGSFSGSFIGTSSYANNANLLDGLNSTVFATTSSNIFVGNQIVSGSVTLIDSVTIQSTSSIPNYFGNNIADQHIFTGSITATGPINVQNTGIDPNYFGDNILDQHIFTGSVKVMGYITLNNTLYTSSQFTAINSGSTVVVSVPTQSYNSGFVDYVIYKPSNIRAGTVMATWLPNTSTVEYTDTSTADLGNTSDVNFEVVIVSQSFQLVANSISSNWTAKTTLRLL
jgi:hypothetical protein